MPSSSPQTLDERLKDGALSLPAGLELLAAVAEALQKLHATGGAHGLLTPSAIQLQRDAQGRIEVRLLELEATRDTNQALDVWALGVLAFQVLVGRAPAPDETLGTALPGAPPALDRLVSRLLSPSPSDRPDAELAHRQLSELAAAANEPSLNKGPPLSALPPLKRGQRDWASEDAGTQRVDEPGAVASSRENPFAEDEATATVPSPAPSMPTATRAVDDEPTQFVPPKNGGRWSPPASRDNVEPFEPSGSDLPGGSGVVTDPRVARKRRNAQSPMDELLKASQRQPAWVWVLVGAGVAFVMLLLIGLAR